MSVQDRIVEKVLDEVTAIGQLLLLAVLFMLFQV